MTDQPYHERLDAEHLNAWHDRHEQEHTMNTAATTPREAVIYTFVNDRPARDWWAVVALAEDGVMLCSHVSSNEEWAKADIGASDPLTAIGHDKHRWYGKHYPGGYRIEWVDNAAVATHPGLQAAFKAADQLRADIQNQQEDDES